MPSCAWPREAGGRPRSRPWPTHRVPRRAEQGRAPPRRGPRRHPRPWPAPPRCRCARHGGPVPGVRRRGHGQQPDRAGQLLGITPTARTVPRRPPPARDRTPRPGLRPPALPPQTRWLHVHHIVYWHHGGRTVPVEPRLPLPRTTIGSSTTGCSRIEGDPEAGTVRFLDRHGGHRSSHLPRRWPVDGPSASTSPRPSPHPTASASTPAGSAGTSEARDLLRRDDLAAANPGRAPSGRNAEEVQTSTASRSPTSPSGTASTSAWAPSTATLSSPRPQRCAASRACRSPSPDRTATLLV